METIKLTTTIDESGTLRLKVPTQYANQQVEVVVVMQSVDRKELRDANGYPLNFFERLDAFKADDMVVRE